MFENKRKGWHGAYSMTGKMTAEQFNEILHKDDILNCTSPKKLRIKDFFEPDQVVNNLDYLYDNLMSFQIYEKEDKHFTESLTKTVEDSQKNIDSKKIKNLKNFFYTKPIKEIDAAKSKYYAPKYDLVFSKTLTGIKWNKLLGRQKPSINISITNNNNICKKFIKEENKIHPVTQENKCFVNMDNYTKRGDFIELKDIRIRYDKPYNKEQNINSKISENYISNPSNSLSPINKNKKRKANLLLKQSLSEKIKVPNFKKYLSRQYLEILRRKKGFEKNNYISSLSLNYNSNHEKKNSDIKFNHKQNKNKVKKFIGINSISLNNCLKNIDKYNNHLSPKLINIKLMPSRSYYENIKNNIDKPCDHLGPSYSSFYKPSFNNIINLKLINSIFFEKKANTKVRNNINKIKNKMIFNNKTYRQLMKENEINKIDGITLKSLKRKNKISK